MKNLSFEEIQLVSGGAPLTAPQMACLTSIKQNMGLGAASGAAGGAFLGATFAGIGAPFGGLVGGAVGSLGSGAYTAINNTSCQQAITVQNPNDWQNKKR